MKEIREQTEICMNCGYAKFYHLEKNQLSLKNPNGVDSCHDYQEEPKYE